MSRWRVFPCMRHVGMSLVTVLLVYMAISILLGGNAYANESALGTFTSCQAVAHVALQDSPTYNGQCVLSADNASDSHQDNNRGGYN